MPKRKPGSNSTLVPLTISVMKLLTLAEGMTVPPASYQPRISTSWPQTAVTEKARQTAPIDAHDNRVDFMLHRSSAGHDYSRSFSGPFLERVAIEFAPIDAGVFDQSFPTSAGAVFADGTLRVIANSQAVAWFLGDGLGI